MSWSTAVKDLVACTYNHTHVTAANICFTVSHLPPITTVLQPFSPHLDTTYHNNTSKANNQQPAATRALPHSTADLLQCPIQLLHLRAPLTSPH